MLAGFVAHFWARSIGLKYRPQPGTESRAAAFCAPPWPLRLILLFGVSAMGHAASVAEFGAKGDGVADDTAAVQAAVDACAAKGEPLVFPAGTFMTGTVRLRSHTAIELTPKAVWMGIGRIDAYPVQKVNFSGGKYTSARRTLIFAEDVEDISLRGLGWIDGNGGQPAFPKTPNNPDRPYGIWIVRGHDIRIEGIRMRNSAFWMQHYSECDHLRLTGIRVFNHANLNNDGVDIDDCHDVVVSDSEIDSSDDALCLKSEGERGVSDVVIANCILSSHADFFKMGTASRGGFRRITATNLVIRPSAADHVVHPMKMAGGLAGIDLMSSDGGTLEDIVIQNVVMEGVETPLVIKLGDRWALRAKSLPGSGASAFVSTPRDPAATRTTAGVVREITISHVIARRCGPIPSSITGYPGQRVENITLSDIQLEIEGGRPAHDQPVPENSNQYPYNRIFGRELPAYGFFVRHATNVTFRNIEIRTLALDQRRAVIFEDATGVLENVEVPGGPDASRPAVLVDRDGTIGLRGTNRGMKVEVGSTGRPSPSSPPIFHP